MNNDKITYIPIMKSSLPMLEAMNPHTLKAVLSAYCRWYVTGRDLGVLPEELALYEQLKRSARNVRASMMQKLGLAENPAQPDMFAAKEAKPVPACVGKMQPDSRYNWVKIRRYRPMQEMFESDLQTQRRMSKMLKVSPNKLRQRARRILRECEHDGLAVGGYNEFVGRIFRSYGLDTGTPPDKTASRASEKEKRVVPDKGRSRTFVTTVFF